MRSQPTQAPARPRSKRLRDPRHQAPVPPAPDVSIVIVAHSARRDLERCLDSIVRHAEVPVETIVVDNASEDGSAPWVRSAHPEVELVELDENIGVAARQEGLARAAGRYIMFLDSDAALTPEALPRMVEAMDANPSWGLIGPRLVGDDGELQLSCRRFPPLVLPVLRRPPLSRYFDDSEIVRRHLMADADHDSVREVVYVLGACQLFRASLAREAGEFDQRIFLGPDDIDWCIRIRDAGGAVVYFPRATVVHSYMRRTKRNPFTRTAWRHLKSFYAFQWRYRRRRRELFRLGAELDH
jgi:GT2 family glycosyltransferase